MKKIRVGFWKSAEEPDLPVPVAREAGDRSFLKRTFLRSLTSVEELATEASYKGVSKCRICGCRNGSTEYSYGKYVWPSGLRHYVEAHDVQLPSDFVDFITEEAV